MFYHSISNYTLKDLEKLSGGSYSDVYKAILNDKLVVVKRYHTIHNPLLWNSLLSQNLNLRNYLNPFIRTPELIYAGFDTSFFTIEDYLGTPLSEILASDYLDTKKTSILKDCVDRILGFPENLYLDTRPSNFVIDPTGIISFIDFMPPNPWSFLDTEIHLRKDFEKSFPSVINAFDRRFVREKRYTLNKYRLVKFFHYLDIKQ